MPTESSPTILVVEDDPTIRNLVLTTLDTQGFRHLSESTGRGAIAASASSAPDVVLLDLGLPDIDGIEVVRAIRSWSQMPIIVVSARSEDADKIGALDAGADDYLTKPFSVGELLARIRTTLRRLNYQSPAQGQEPSTFQNGDLRIDYTAGIAYLGDGELHLTPIEYKLLCLLSHNVDKVLTHSFILHEGLEQQPPGGPRLASRLHGNPSQEDRARPGSPALHPNAHWRGLPHDARRG